MSDPDGIDKLRWPPVATLPPEPVGEVEGLIDAFGKACETLVTKRAPYQSPRSEFDAALADRRTAKAALLAWCRAKGGR